MGSKIQRLQMKLKKMIFSYDRPIQLQGLCQSILQNSDLLPSNLWAVCRSSNERYRSAYEHVGKELGIHIVHENRTVPGIDFRQIYEQTAWLPRGRRAIARQIARWTTMTPLPQNLLNLTADADYVSLAVDDMVYFRATNFARAAALLADNPEICLWSWRIGADRYPNPNLQLHDWYWTIAHDQMPIPYGYIFHVDGSLFRRADLEQWLLALPQDNTINPNILESRLWTLVQQHRQRFNFGPLHAGPLQQTCVTWQINRVSSTAQAKFHAESYSNPKYLLEAYLAGSRLDYSALYGSAQWLTQLNHDQPEIWTHIAPTQEAAEKWFSLVKNHKGHEAEQDGN